MAAANNPPWAEIVQLVPILSLAFPFIVRGEVDLSGAGSGFLVGAVLTVPITALVLRRGYLLNPILVGTDLWLWMGALAFNLPWPGLASWLGETQAFSLFVAVLGAGLVATMALAGGYVACRTRDSRWLLRGSLGLLALTVAAVLWAWLFRSDIRLGGGLPFIVLNVVRRILVQRAPDHPADQGMDPVVPGKA